MGRKARAVICREAHQPVVVEEIEVDSPGPEEVMIKLAACGVCHSDFSATNGTIDYPLPLILGHEGAGVVVEAGERVRGLAVGDHVVSSFVTMCGHCRYCVTGRPVLCDAAANAYWTLPDGSLRTRDAQGVPLNVFQACGVMAEYATLHQNNVVKIRDDVPLASAALVGCAVMTGVGAVINTARLEAGSSAVVFGAGGVGLNVIQGCAIAGAQTIVAIDTHEDKLATATLFGATHTVNAKTCEDVVKAVKKLTDGGADYGFECIGSGATVTLTYRAVRKGGTAIVIGVANSKDKTEIATLSLPALEKTLAGSWYGSARPIEDFPRLFAMYKNGRLKLDELITTTYRIDQAAQAFADLEAGRNARGVITFE